MYRNLKQHSPYFRAATVRLVRTPEATMANPRAFRGYDRPASSLAMPAEGQIRHLPSQCPRYMLALHGILTNAFEAGCGNTVTRGPPVTSISSALASRYKLRSTFGWLQLLEGRLLPRRLALGTRANVPGDVTQPSAVPDVLER